MKDTLELILSLFREFHALRKWFGPKQIVPQSEIDKEARRLIAEHGDGAIEVAEGFVKRAQQAETRKQYARLLKAVTRDLN